MPFITQLTEFHLKLRKWRVFEYLYLLSIAAIIIGFVYSRALLSIGQIAMAAIWLLEGDFKVKFNRLINQKIAIFFSGFYLLHVLWLFNTNDFNYAAEDLRIKLPLLLFPIIFSTTDFLKFNVLRLISFLFVVVIFSSTVTISLNYFLLDQPLADIREASFLISHIRLALMICLSIVISLYFAGREKLLISILLIGVSMWMLFYMLYFVYLTGIIILSAVLLVMLVVHLRRMQLKRNMKLTIFTTLSLSLFVVGFFGWQAVSDYISSSGEKQVPDIVKTKNNRPYTQWYESGDYKIRENGYLVFQNLNFKEVESEWNKRSPMKISFLDDYHQEAEDIILRFISSKGLAKDSAAVASLQPEEIRAVEMGVTNVNLLGKSGFYKRIYTLCWEYDVYRSGGNINGLSFATRLEYWKTGINVLKRNYFKGTGTGDIEVAFQEQYTADKSRLEPKWRFRSHNQIISVAATFGLIGLLYFIVMLLYPTWIRRRDFLYLSFSLIFLLSILGEDTLETQIGVTFYAFFNSLFYFSKRENSA